MCNKTLECCKTEYGQVLHFIQSHRNGEVVDSMAARGINYNMSYGLSINQINTFAKTLQKNNHLAQQLWQEPMREAKLFALHLFNPQTISMQEIEQLIPQLCTAELVEQAVFAFLSKTDILAEHISAWCLNSNQLIATTGVSVITRMALTRKELTNEYFGTFFAILAQRLVTANKPLHLEIAKAVLAMARRSAELKAQAQQWVIAQEQIEKSVCVQIVTDELLYV